MLSGMHLRPTVVLHHISTYTAHPRKHGYSSILHSFLGMMTESKHLFTRVQIWRLNRYVLHGIKGKHYMVAHHIVVQHKLIEHCVQRLVSSTLSQNSSFLYFLLLACPFCPFMSFYVLLCTYSSSSVLTSPFLSLLVL